MTIYDPQRRLRMAFENDAVKRNRWIEYHVGNLYGSVQRIAARLGIYQSLPLSTDGAVASFVGWCAAFAPNEEHSVMWMLEDDAKELAWRLASHPNYMRVTGGDLQFEVLTPPPPVHREETIAGIVLPTLYVAPLCAAPWRRA